MRQSNRLARRIANDWCQRGSLCHLSAEERVSKIASTSLGSIIPRKEYFGKSDGWTVAGARVPFETVSFEHSFASSTAPPPKQSDAIQTGMTLPSMEDLRLLNPEIAEIMDQHEATQQYGIYEMHACRYTYIQPR